MPTPPWRAFSGASDSAGGLGAPCVTCGHRSECVSPTVVRTHHTIGAANHHGHQQYSMQKPQQFLHQPSTTTMIVNTNNSSISRRSPPHHQPHSNQLICSTAAQQSSLMDVNGTYLCTTYNPGCIIMRKVISYARYF